MTDNDLHHATVPSVARTFDLDPAEWLILWGVRYWVACHCSGRPSWPLLKDVFGRNRVADVAFCLDGILRLTCVAATRSLDIRCPACPWMSADERCVLEAVGCAQRGDSPECLRLLRGWLPAAAARMALQMTTGLAQILADADYRLRSDPGRRLSYLDCAEGTPAGSIH